MRRRLAPLVTFAVLSLMVVAGYYVIRWTLVPAVPRADALSPSTFRTIDIPEGASLRQVALLLENERLIPHRWGIELLAKLTWSDRRIMAGEYVFHPGMRPIDILSDILNGRVLLHPVTIPEGHTVAQIADLLEQKGLAQKAEILKLAHDREFIRTLNLEVAGLEGYLFPNTYHVAKHTKAKDLIKTFMDALWQAFTPELRGRAHDVHLSVHEVLTLASIIEKETSVADEREIVSAVFHNRLRKKIRLQSDPTVIYGLAAFDGDLRKRDLHVASPYNTYRVRGLPPGPIASPGAGAIRAALYPASANYLYFVSRNDGTHEFSATLAQHNKAVTKYQRRRNHSNARQRASWSVQEPVRHCRSSRGEGGAGRCAATGPEKPEAYSSPVALAEQRVPDTLRSFPGTHCRASCNG